jgi:hypothetical protein
VGINYALPNLKSKLRKGDDFTVPDDDI